MEKKDVITFKGSPLTLLGEQIKVGDKAIDFKAKKIDLSDFELNQNLGEVLVIASMPSVDTPVCEMETIKFNKEASELENVKIITISEDLPFALERFCAAKSIKNALTLSDYKDNEFGKKYGLLIKELKLLTRAVIVIDKLGVVKYVEIVPDITQEPDYKKALEVVKALAK
ncbi:thiol peroxidase [Cetobacterium sp. 2A]|uniref:thiol peroxidase n=1 Tax=unclassified Cetobacterium TaxID=2630983 RepID=UPI00163CF5D5|nr:thiol peroxidase [Cetobacterium sp. 2A]MBC2855004.1 thiol peroxidase [Cetobacterium sp. 2A]